MSIPHVLKRAICLFAQQCSLTDNHLEAIVFVFTAVVIVYLFYTDELRQRANNTIKIFKTKGLHFTLSLTPTSVSIPHVLKRVICTTSLTANHLEESKQLSSLILVFTAVVIVSQFYADKK